MSIEADNIRALTAIIGPRVDLHQIKDHLLELGVEDVVVVDAINQLWNVGERRTHSLRFNTEIGRVEAKLDPVSFQVLQVITTAHGEVA